MTAIDSSNELTEKQKVRKLVQSGHLKVKSMFVLLYSSTV